MSTRWIIGLASGTSGDGVDAALVEVDGAGLELRARVAATRHLGHSRDLRELLLRLGSGGPSETRQVSLLHRLLGETFATAARQVADQASFTLQRVHCVGCPGHVLWHEPDGRFPSYLAVGLPAVVAERSGLTTVADFAGRDLAAGGLGTPVGTLAEALLFGDPHEDRLLLHLGAAVRVVFLPAGADLQRVVGFDAGPGNELLDGLVRRASGGKESCDVGGKHAVQGRCLEPLLERWLTHPYLSRRPPKCLPRNLFGAEFAQPALEAAGPLGGTSHDVLCTATHFIVRAVAASVRRFVPAAANPGRVLLCGGGVRNGLLLRLLEQQFPAVPMVRTDSFGVPADGVKAVAHAVLAALTLDGVPANIPAATGAGGRRLLGTLTPGSSANWSRCLAWMAAQCAPPAMVGEAADW